MKRILGKIGSFYFLRISILLVLGIMLIYAEEDWRGARAWAATQAEWEAKGESFDRARFVPPPVPDGQNLAALPLFKYEMEEGLNGVSYLQLKSLLKAMRSGPPQMELPSLGSWSKGELPDMAAIRASIGSDYAAIFPGTKAPASTMAQFDALFPFLTELRSASASRPTFRLEMDYAIEPPSKRPLGSLAYTIRIARLLTLHALLALHEQRTDLALSDLRLCQEFLEGVQRDPSMVGSLAAIGIRAISNVAVFDGLAEHLWSDAQLAEIDHLLKPIDLLATFQFAIRSEIIFSTGTIDYLRQPGHQSDFDISASPTDKHALSAATFFADGWWNDNKRQIAVYYFRELTEVDPQARRVFPDVARQLSREVGEAQGGWTATAPWNLFFTSVSPGMSLAVQKFAEGQVSVDETRIACALERFRLAHGVYPATLAELTPACIDAVPHDIMDGEAYRYRLKTDGTFLLYSVGWNQTDEGGTVALKTGDPKTIDFENGDWVWPAAKTAN